MADYLTPDVYIEEVPSGARPIQAVGTRTAAFVGQAPAADRHVGEAVAVNNWLQFVREFVATDSAGTTLANAVYGFFQNGGSRCFIVNTPDDQPIAGGPKGGGLQALETEDEVAIVAAPGRADQDSYQALLAHCEQLKDRVAIMDAPLTVDSVEQLTRVGLVKKPGSGPAAGGSPGAGGAGGGPAGGPKDQAPGLRPPPSDGGYGTVYFPGITVRDAISGELVDVHPSGHIAGIWARTDATRGVHKAPANELVRGALNVT